MGTEVHLLKKISFSSDFGHFILKMLENAKFSHVRKKDTEISQLLGGHPPLIFHLRGTRPPSPCFRRPWGDEHPPPPRSISAPIGRREKSSKGFGDGEYC